MTEREKTGICVTKRLRHRYN